MWKQTKNFRNSKIQEFFTEFLPLKRVGMGQGKLQLPSKVFCEPILWQVKFALLIRSLF